MSNIIQKARRVLNYQSDEYALESNKKCGLFPHKYIDMEFSRRSDILRQAANRIVTGESTFATEVFMLAYYLTKFKRLDKLTSKKLLVSDLRRLVRKADIDNKFTALYQHIHKKDDTIMKILESAVENNAGAKARFHQLQYDRWYTKKQKQIEEYRIKVQEVRDANKKDRLAQEYAYHQFRAQNTIVGEIADRCISPTLPPVSPAPDLDDMPVFDTQAVFDTQDVFGEAANKRVIRDTNTIEDTNVVGFINTNSIEDVNTDTDTTIGFTNPFINTTTEFTNNIGFTDNIEEWADTLFV